MRGRVVRVAAATAAALAAGTTVAAGGPVGVTSERLTSLSVPTTATVTTCTQTSSADTYGDELYSGTNYGTAASAYVSSADLLTLGLGNRRTFVSFDLSACGIPSNADVRSASLRLHLADAPGSSRTYLVNRVTGSWGETTLTWSNQPSVSSTATASASTGTTDGVTQQWDVSADVSAFVAGTATNHGWRVSDSSESALLLSYTGRFSTKEAATASHHPQLVVTYYP